MSFYTNYTFVFSLVFLIIRIFVSDMAKRLDASSFISECDTGIIIDVRTPAEFALGHIPGAQNIPLFTNEQRVVVGTIYKHQGREVAIQKGLEFVGPRMAEIASQCRQLAKGKDIYLHCWRGGMRSASVAWLLELVGLKVTLLEGGYKAYRSHFEWSLTSNPWQFILLAGPTGCGKTRLLKALEQQGEQVLDLEGIANHRGSVFGGIGKGAQPTTEQFINMLHNAFNAFNPARPVWCEGESKRVGAVYIPDLLFEKLNKNTVIEVSMNKEQRLDMIMAEYGELQAEALEEAFVRISKRMGPEQSKQAITLVHAGNIRAAAALGLDYYDKYYFRKHASGREVIKLDVDGKDMNANLESLLKIKEQIYGNID